MNDNNKLVSVTPFATFPPQMGGQVVIHDLYSCFPSLGWQIDQFSMGIRRYDLFKGKSEIMISNTSGYREWRRIEFFSLLSFCFAAFLKIPNIWAGRTARFSSWTALQKSLSTSRAIFLEMPWGFSPSLLAKHNNQPLVYLSHNAEFVLADSWRRKFPIIGNYLAGAAGALESEVLRQADLIISISQEDVALLDQQYPGLVQEKVAVVPRGIDLNQYPVIQGVEKNRLRQKLGIGDQLVIAFSGSSHPPNVEAARYVCELAPQMDNSFLWIVAGSVAKILHPQRSANLWVEVGDPLEYLKTADIAINPVSNGSGLNIKMLQYLAFGLPVITTPFGARGIPGIDQTHYLVREQAKFLEAVNSLADDPLQRAYLGCNGRKLVEDNFSAKNTAQALIEVVEQWYQSHPVDRADAR